jgi:hypothetical protein
MRFFFRWYNLWIGAYWDSESRALYVCPLPMLGVCIQCGPCDVARGRALTLITLQYAISRKWYERIPWLGDRWLRKRLRVHWSRRP